MTDGSKQYILVKDQIVFHRKLTANEKVLLLVLLAYNRDVLWGKKEKIYPSQQTLAEECNMSRSSIVRAVNGLRKHKLIKTSERPDLASLIYELTTGALVPNNDRPVPNIHKAVSNNDRGCSKLTQGVVPNNDTISTIYKDYKELDKKKVKKKEKVRVPDIPYEEILNDFNKKAGTTYLSSTKATVTHINNAWEFTLQHPVYKDDPIKAFFTVNSQAVKQCSGDQKKWLAPQYVYRCGPKQNTFETYLNQPIEVKKDYGPL